MDNNNNVLVLFTLVAFFVLAFVFALFGLAETNALFLVLAIIGFVIALIVGLVFGLTNAKDGGRIAVWFFLFSGAVSISTVWFVTRIGRIFGLL